MYQYQKVAFQQILEGREQRAHVQKTLRELYKTPVVSITVNMPGELKCNHKAVSLLYDTQEKIRKQLRNAGYFLWEERVLHLPSGSTAILAVDGKADVIKKITVDIEEETNYGRLLDIDVFDVNGRQIDRAFMGLELRKCFVCPQIAAVCVRSQAHDQLEVIAEAEKLFVEYKARCTEKWPKIIETIGTAAVTAMLMEAACAPAPGLVDRFNPGCHQDMDFFTFIQSTSALAPYMYRFALAGWEHEGPVADLLPILREIGKNAERTMFEATKGVNTQKGLLFLMGVLTAATSLCVKKRPGEQLAVQLVLQEASDICRGLVERELGCLKNIHLIRKLTAGERLYLSYGVTGIRGEIEEGLPTVMLIGIPCLRDAINAGLSLNDALVHALIGIMCATVDTTILNRHDLAVLQSVQSDAKSIMLAGGMLTAAGRQSIKSMDERYSRSRISPGGSADLLAASYFLYSLTETGACL
ncbi:MAG: citrate lyase holo-[acyl-carrier protein] synthase [Negativicutes bacterium]